MSVGETIRVTVNGEEHRVRAGTRLVDLLEQIDEPYAAAVVEHNRRYVHQHQLSVIALEDGDHIEIILPAFGG